MSQADTLRDALHQEAAAVAEGAADWDNVLRRARSIHRRRRTAATAGVFVASAVVILTLLVSTGALDADPDRTIATPTTARTSVVAALDDRRVVVLSPTDGRVLRTIVDDRKHPLSGNISVSPSGEFVYFSRLRDGAGTCNDKVIPEIVRVRTSSGKIDAVVAGGYDPLVSPDGRWLVYSSRTDPNTPPCSPPLSLHLLDLSTMQEVSRLYDAPGGSGVEPESWSSDSSRVLALVRHADPTQNELIEIQVSDAGTVADRGISLLVTGAMTAATYLHDDGIVVAALRPNQVTLKLAPDVANGREFSRIELDSRPDALAPYGVEDQLLAHLPDGTLQMLQTQVTREPVRTIARNVSAAAWLPHSSAPPR